MLGDIDQICGCFHTPLPENSPSWGSSKSGIILTKLAQTGRFVFGCPEGGGGGGSQKEVSERLENHFSQLIVIVMCGCRPFMTSRLSMVCSKITRKDYSDGGGGGGALKEGLESSSYSPRHRPLDRRFFSIARKIPSHKLSRNLPAPVSQPL